MIDPQELLFSVDENNNPIDPQPRDKSHKEKIWHRTSHVFVINPKNQILCQQRSSQKDSRPGFWEPFFGGHLAPGQDYKDGALSELNEELGINAQLEGLLFLAVHRYDKGTEFQGKFAYKWSGDITNLRPEEEEIQALAWHDLARVREIFRTRSDPKWSFMGDEAIVFEWLETLK